MTIDEELDHALEVILFHQRTGNNDVDHGIAEIKALIASEREKAREEGARGALESLRKVASKSGSKTVSLRDIEYEITELKPTNNAPEGQKGGEA